MLILASNILISCASTPKSEIYNGNKKSGHWAGKVQIKDLKKSNTQTLNFDILAIQNEKLRMEVATTVGINIASLAINHNKISYSLWRAKKYYSGSVGEKALSPLFNIDLNPVLLYAMLFEDVPTQNGWDCAKDDSAKLSKCESKHNKISILWSERQGDLKRITTLAPGFEVQILVKEYTTKVEENVSTWLIDVPDSFLKLSLP